MAPHQKSNALHHLRRCADGLPALGMLIADGRLEIDQHTQPASGEKYLRPRGRQRHERREDMRGSRGQGMGTVWDQLQQLQGEMNRLFERWAGPTGTGATRAEFPPVNVWEEADQLFVEAELPGLDLKGLEIYVTGGNQLTIQGEAKPPVAEKSVWHRRERQFGRFSRTLTLPYPVDPDKVEARLENGVLQIRLAKHESARPRKITVKAE